MPKSRKFIPATTKHAKIVRAAPHPQKRDRSSDSLSLYIRLPKLWCDALEKMYPKDSLSKAASKHIILTIVPEDAQENKEDTVRVELLRKLEELMSNYDITEKKAE